ncbi:hypothetical protein CDG61_04555 [Acinetobacter sp. WCHAc010052]|nr:hypothetical protein CDG61_04555 [Acinetobacter sp. WCHAc010052]
MLFSFFYVLLLFNFYKKKKLNCDHVFSFKRGLLILIFIIFGFTGVLSKLNILFLYDIEDGFNKSSEKNIIMKGYFKTGTSKQGGDIWAYADSAEDERYDYVLVCDFIKITRCDYGDFKGESFILKSFRPNLKFLDLNDVVYELRRMDGSTLVSSSEQIKIYKDNKRSILIYFILIVTPLLCFYLFFYLMLRGFKND